MTIFHVVFTLFCLNKWAIPFVSVLTAVDFCSIIFSRFNFTSPTTKTNKANMKGFTTYSALSKLAPLVSLRFSEEEH